MASKGQKFRKWSKEEKLRIVKLHMLEHQSLRQISQRENVYIGVHSKAGKHPSASAGTEHVRFQNIVANNWNVTAQVGILKRKQGYYRG